MAISAVGSPVVATAGSGTTLTLPSNTWTSGNFIALWVDFEDAAATLSASGGGNSFTALTQPSPDGVHGGILYAYNITGGTFQITVTFSGSVPYCIGVAQEYSGLTTTDPLDQQATGFDGGSPSALTSTSAISTTQNDELILVGLGLYGSQTIVTGTGGTGAANWTPVHPSTIGTNNNFKLFSRIVSSTGSYQVVGTSGDANALELNAAQNWVASIASFKAAAGGGGGTVTWLPVVQTVQGKSWVAVDSGFNPSIK